MTSTDKNNKSIYYFNILIVYNFYNEYKFDKLFRQHVVFKMCRDVSLVYRAQSCHCKPRMNVYTLQPRLELLGHTTLTVPEAHRVEKVSSHGMYLLETMSRTPANVIIATNQSKL